MTSLATKNVKYSRSVLNLYPATTHTPDPVGLAREASWRGHFWTSRKLGSAGARFGQPNMANEPRRVVSTINYSPIRAVWNRTCTPMMRVITKKLRRCVADRKGVGFYACVSTSGHSLVPDSHGPVGGGPAGNETMRVTTISNPSARSQLWRSKEKLRCDFSFFCALEGPLCFSRPRSGLGRDLTIPWRTLKYRTLLTTR